PKSDLHVNDRYFRLAPLLKHRRCTGNEFVLIRSIDRHDARLKVHTEHGCVNRIKCARCHGLFSSTCWSSQSIPYRERSDRMQRSTLEEYLANLEEYLPHIKLESRVGRFARGTVAIAWRTRYQESLSLTNALRTR